MIKGFIIRYCCSRSEDKSRNRDFLVRLIDHLKLKVDAGSSCIGPYHSALSELAKMDLEAAKGAQVWSRIRWVEEGETSYSFFRLEKKRSLDWWISTFRRDDSTIVSSPEDLCDCLSGFYSSLFSASATDFDAQAELLGNISSVLPTDMAALCEGHLSTDEVFTALRCMARRKAPGSDGLPMVFYLKFWNLLGSDLVWVLNSCLDSGCMSSSQRQGVISLSYKKGDCLDPPNWRPISQLNVDYKLASRSVAGHLLKVIHLVVDKDQTCGVPGRFIGENVALLHDVVNYSTSTGVPVAVL